MYNVFVMNIKDIEKLAQLARIELSGEEKQALLKDVDEILAFVSQVQEVVTEDRAEERVGDIHNVMRDDAEPHESGVYTEELLEEVPKTEDGYVKVKRIL